MESGRRGKSRRPGVVWPWGGYKSARKTQNFPTPDNAKCYASIQDCGEAWGRDRSGGGGFVA